LICELLVCYGLFHRASGSRGEEEMARPWRIQYAGAYYHVLSRGNAGRDVFRDDVDRKVFLETLGETCDRFGVEVYAFVLMTNHYHFLLQTGAANLSRAMQWFGVTYTRRFNSRHFRRGHLFQGRFKSILVESDAYVVELSCYIHRNPLRAGMVKSGSGTSCSSIYGREAPIPTVNLAICSALPIPR
jgi:putative transposase